MAAWALKPNIEVKQEGTSASLVDPASGRSLALTADEAYVVGLMDGSSGPAQLEIAAKAQGRPVGAAVIAGLFERLTAGGFLEPKVQSPPPAPPRPFSDLPPPAPAAPRAFNELPPLPPPPPSPGNLPPRARAAPLPPLGSPAAWASPGATPAPAFGAPAAGPIPPAASSPGKAPLSSPSSWAAGATAGLFLPLKPVAVRPGPAAGPPPGGAASAPPGAPATDAKVEAPEAPGKPAGSVPAAAATFEAPAAAGRPAAFSPAAEATTEAPGASGALASLPLGSGAPSQAPDISGAFPAILLGTAASEASPSIPPGTGSTLQAPDISGAFPSILLGTHAKPETPAASEGSPWISLGTEAPAEAPEGETFEILAARESFVGPAPTAPSAPAVPAPYPPQRTASGSMPRITPQELNLTGAGQPPQALPPAATATPAASPEVDEPNPPDGGAAAAGSELPANEAGPAPIRAPAPAEEDDAEITDRIPRRRPPSERPPPREEADDAEITDRISRRADPPEKRGKLRWVVLAFLLLGSAAAVTVPVQGEVSVPCVLRPKAETPVAAPRELVIKGVAAKNGQWVEKSTLLVTLEAPAAQDEFDRLTTEIASLETQLTTLQASVQRANVDKAEAAVSRAEHEVEVARKALSKLEKARRKPARKLAKARAAVDRSTRSLEKARAAHARASFKDQIAQAVAALAQKRGEQEAARIDLAEASVLSPAPGVVALGPKAVAGGKLAEAEVLATIRDSQTLIASAGLSGADATLVRENQPVSIRVEGHAIKGAAHLGTADPATRTVGLEVELDNHERVFGPDQLCEALLPVAPLTPFEAAQRLVRNQLAKQ